MVDQYFAIARRELVFQWWAQQCHRIKRLGLPPDDEVLYEEATALLRSDPEDVTPFVALSDKIDRIGKGAARSSSEAVWLGDGRVTVGDQSFTLEPQLADVLQSLVELRTATKPQLQEHSGRDEPDKLLKKLVERYPAIAPYVRRPGGRGKGGYSTTIRVAPK